MRHGGLVRPPAALGYLGWAGQGNLGDDLMYEAQRRALRPLRLTPLPVSRIEQRLGALSRVPGGLRVRAMLLGGGTLFGRTDWWERIESVRAFAAGAQWMALGVGVEDDAFESDRVFTDRASMRRWVEFAASWPVLGVRGPRSREILASHGLDAEVTGDPALLLATAGEPVAVRERLLGVSVAVPEARWGDAGAAAATVEQALDRLTASGWRLRFFVFSKWDRERTAALRGRLGDRAELCDATTPGALLRALGECHVVLGERLHAVVMACAAGTPAIGLEYRPKIRDFLLSVDRDRCALRADRLAPRELEGAILAIAEDRDAEAAHLRHAVADLSARLRSAARAAVAVAR